jgi:plastocyanin
MTHIPTFRLLLLLPILAGILIIPTVLQAHAEEYFVYLNPGGPDYCGIVDSTAPTVRFCYVPREITISQGDTVVWTNNDADDHTVTAGLPLIVGGKVGLDYPSGFHSDIINSDESFTHTFNQPGEYPYFSLKEPWITGVVIVESSSEPEPTDPIDSTPEPPSDTTPPPPPQDNNDPGDNVIDDPPDPIDTTDPTPGDDPTPPPPPLIDDDDGGCLIATAAFGSELSSQVQQLREIRNNKILSTHSGTSFMHYFNSVYYSFSPQIADMQRQSPVFNELVRASITPMIMSLSLMDVTMDNSESSVLVIGSSIILLNGLIYAGIPATAIFFTIKRYRKNKLA